METSVFDVAAIARDAVQGQRQRQQLCVDPPPSPSSSAELCSDGLNAEAFLVDDYLDLSFVCYDTSDMTETLPVREGEEEREAISKEEEVSFIPAFDLCLPSDELVHQLEWLSNFVEDSFSTDQNDSAWPTPKAMDIVKKRPPSFIQEEEEDEEEEEEEEEEQDDTTSVIISSSLLIRACTVFSSSMLVMKRPCTPSSESSNGRDNNGNVLVGFNFNAKEDTFSSLSSYHVLGKKKRGEGGEGGVLKRKMKMMMKTNKMKKKKKKKKKDRNGKTSTSGAVAHRPTDNLASLPPRRCAHCQVHKTPQWRAGPMGPKTLCNACGVRYKSGRLLPEYRPAGSPTFITSLHSNSHQKILEMRRHYQVTSPHGRSSPDGTSTTTMETCTTTS